MTNDIDVGELWTRAEEALEKERYQEALEFYVAWKERALEIEEQKAGAFFPRDLESADYCIGVCQYYLGHVDEAKSAIIKHLQFMRAESVSRRESLAHHFNNRFRDYLHGILMLGAITFQDLVPETRADGYKEFLDSIDHVVMEWASMLDDKFTGRLIAKRLIDRREI